MGWAVGVLNPLENALNELFDECGSAAFDSWDLTWSFTTGLWTIGGAVGSVVGGPVSNLRLVGRKRGLFLTCGLMALGSYLEAHPFFFEYPKNYEGFCGGSYDLILAGRFISGIACGLTTAIAPVYLNEIAPINLKGLFGNLNQFTCVIGILFVWVVGLKQVSGAIDCQVPLDENFECPVGKEDVGAINRFSLTLGLPLVFCAIQLIILPFIWESPAHLAKFSPEIAANAAEYYGAEIEEDTEENKQVHPRLGCCEPLFIKPLIAVVILHLSQQLTGINAIFFYSTQIFTSAGVSDPEVATCLIGVVSIIFCGASLWLVGCAGGKTLHMYGIGLIGICAGVIALLLGVFQGDDDFDNQAAISICSIVFVLVFTAIFQSGPGPIPWGMATQLFDDTNRSRATAIGSLVNWGANTAIAFGFPLLEAIMGGHVFWIFCGFNFFFFFMVMIFVPETKDKTLREIQAFFVPSILNEEEAFSKHNEAFKAEENKEDKNLGSEEFAF